jgi:hypothetical protein
MSKMDPYQYFFNFVEQNYEEWKIDQGSLSKAFNVAVPAFHLTDNYFLYFRRHDRVFAKRYGEKDLGKIQAALARRSKYFRTIQGMATAYKHLFTNVKCDVPSGGAVYSVTINGETIEPNFEDQGGKYVSWIEIKRRNGSTVKFETAINDVIEMWRKILDASYTKAAL